jgi:iron uptake system EfeUOB component EfeO/EfeM
MLINLLIEWLVDAIKSNDIEKASRIQFVLNRIRKERMN